LEHRIAEHELGALFRAPGRKVRLREGAARQPLARLAEHVGRRVEPDHLGVGIALDQQLGRIARPAAEIDHAPRRRERHLRQQIARRARAVVLELEILAGGPVGRHQRAGGSN